MRWLATSQFRRYKAHGSAYRSYFLRRKKNQIMENESGSVALIVGVTGMVGFSLAQTLKNPKTPGSPWTVYGSSRRAPPVWFGPDVLDRFVRFDALDRDETVKALAELATRVTHVFWVALAVREREEEEISANKAMLENVLFGLTCVDGLSRLRHVALQTGTKHYLGPDLDPSRMDRIGPIEVPFREDTPRLKSPVFYYALEDVLISYSHTLTWTVHRSSLIFGASSCSIYNFVLTLIAYALICRYESSPYVYPGSIYTWNHFCDASDADLLAEQQIWAANTPTAAYQAFNCTNGDVFTWRSFWKVMSELFHEEFIDCPSSEEGVGPDWPERLTRKGPTWDAIVEANGLVKTKLNEIANFDVVYAFLNIKFQHMCCMNKSREFGFFNNVDTLKSLKKWVGRLRDMNLIPKD